LKKNNLPVFPLGLVALPGSIQSLQIFEPRYINMVKGCMSNGHGFIIVLQSKLESISDYGMSKKGTYVEIIDFNNLPNGLLGITVKSQNKVNISNICQLEDGLHVADAKPEIDPEVDDQAILAEYPEISNILTQLMKHPRISDLQIKVDFSSADSVAYNLAGLIPLSSFEKQNLLEAFDASQRMGILAKYIENISTT
jgi:Lon protease-like protein